MIEIFLAGASGRMGAALQEVIREEKNMNICGGLGSSTGSKLFSKNLPKTPGEVDVVIDFSSPEIFSQVLQWCVLHKRPFVSGTTGLSEKQYKEMRSASKKIPILWAPNMSVGIATLKKMITALEISQEFDVHLLEYHHNKKKDAPSGTAKALEQLLKKKTKKYVGTSSIRGGGIFGVHRIDLMAESEVIVLEHTALDRKVFARGAVVAARWISKKKPGQYGMQDAIS
jgi:4-hydroxy-tetrahydrodipicolinate reductase